MNRSVYMFVGALGFSLTPGCGDDDDDGGGESIRDLCEEACATAAGLSCPNDDAAACVSECAVDEEALGPCLQPARAALECVAERPASDWECDTDGEAALKDGICDEEGSALLVCVFGNTEAGTCPFEEDQECDDPTGTDLCPAGTDLVDCSGG